MHGHFLCRRRGVNRIESAAAAQEMPHTVQQNTTLSDCCSRGLCPCRLPHLLLLLLLLLLQQRSPAVAAAVAVAVAVGAAAALVFATAGQIGLL